jgi:prepilin-type N-terminal cleavage/methylation domain-containing protein
MTRRNTAGFTLIEMLVVIVILSILLTIIGAIISEVMARARYTKTLGIINTLAQGCEQYRSEDTSRAYPGPGGDNTASSSKVLHYCLGRVRDHKMIGVQASKAKPFIQFKMEWLDTTATTTDPGTSITSAKLVTDGWKVPLYYNTADDNLFEVKRKLSLPAGESFAIQSAGADMSHSLTDDNVGNWELAGTTN